MPHQVTVTGKVGPGTQVTSLVITDVNQVLFNPDAKQIRIRVNGPPSGNIKDVDIAAATTVTCTITGANYAFVVS